MRRPSLCLMMNEKKGKRCRLSEILVHHLRSHPQIRRNHRPFHIQDPLPRRCKSSSRMILGCPPHRLPWHPTLLFLLYTRLSENIIIILNSRRCLYDCGYSLDHYLLYFIYVSIPTMHHPDYVYTQTRSRHIHRTLSRHHYFRAF